MTQSMIFAFAIIPYLAEGNPAAALPYLTGLVGISAIIPPASRSPARAI